MKKLIIIIAMSFTFLGLFGQTRQTFRSVDVNEFE